ncbi:MAG TPA: TonB-dependent receptor [Rhodothermales bacterium]|nr:TonB-dependent receptor [Rhodothermales bacterium]
MKTAYLLVIAVFLPITSFGQTATISGKVIDQQSTEALPGANIVLVLPGESFPVTGTTTDFDGLYRIENVSPGSYDLLVRYVGYSEYRSSLNAEAGASFSLDVGLVTEDVSLNTVIVTASRQQEKILDAPASITVLQAREIEQLPTPSTASALRNVTGVDLAQTGADRYEIVMRGFNNAFSGAAYTLVDYRQGAVPSLAVNAYFLMPISNIDTDRIEVVRGPGSALYGAGVDAGVIHIVTKDPFTSPGTTLALLGGERNLAGVSFRQAGVLGPRLGYKVAGLYTQVDEWELDPFDIADFDQLDANGDDIIAYEGLSTMYIVNDAGDVVEVPTASGVTFDIPRDYDTSKMNLNGMLHYRLSPSTSVIINGGHQQGTSPVLTGVGTAQADGFGYSFGQVRFQSGPFFAQTYYNQNRGGDSFVYGTGADFVDRSNLFNAQAQYDLSFANGRERVIVGADFENTSPDTEGTIYGRNEEDDKITEYGAYVQSTTQVSPKFDLTLAGRLDYNNIQEEVLFSPRAALVFKPARNHSLRGSYNRAFSSPGNNSLFLDIVAGERPVSPIHKIQVRGRGAVDGFTFRRNPAFLAFANSDLVATSNLPLPANIPYGWNTDIPVGMDLGFLYQLVYQNLSQLTAEQISGILGVPIPEAQFEGLKTLLSPQNTVVQGFADGVLAKPGLEGGVTFVDDAISVEPLKQTTSETFELGYKGLINDRILVAVDVYRTRKENFVGPLLFESPIVLVPTLLPEFQAAYTEAITNNQILTGALAQLGFTPAQLAAVVTQIASADLPGPTDPIGIVQPQENLDGPEGPELLLSYRNFGEIDFYGFDIATQVMVNAETSLFATYSHVSDGFFDEEELGEPGKEVSLNAPTNKFKAGINYDHRSGLTMNAAGRWNDAFFVASGPYVGTVPEFFLLDVGVGYDLSQWAPGLRIDVLAQNVLDEKHREFVGAPLIGRFTTARVTYSL